MALPDIAGRLDAVMAALARQTRLYANNVLPAAVNALHESIRSFHWEETHIAIDRHNPKQLDQHRRARDTNRQAVSLLARLANFQPLPKPYSKSRTVPPAHVSTLIETSPSLNPNPRNNPQKYNRPSLRGWPADVLLQDP
jgi:hypothetical protein